MPTETEQLVVSLEARIRDFERNMSRASRTSSREFRSIEEQARRSGDRLERSMGSSLSNIGSNFSRMGREFATGIAGALGAIGFNEVISRAAELTKSIAEIGDEAKKAGLSSKQFQELGYVAAANRIEVGALTDGMKELAMRAAEFASTGSGPGADAFTALGYTASELTRKLKDPAALLEDIADRVKDLPTATLLNIADQIFGGQGGEQLPRLLEQGGDAIRKLRGEAATLTDAQIKAAQEIDAAWSKTWTNFGTNSKSAFIGLMNLAGSTVKYIEGLGEQVGADHWFDHQKISGPSLEQAEKDSAHRQQLSEVADLTTELARLRDLLKNITPMQKALGMDEALRQNIGETEAKIQELHEAIKDTTEPLNGLSTATDDNASAMERAAQRVDNYAAALTNLKNAVPALADAAKTTAELDKINSAYTQAVTNARSMGQIQQATDLANKARASVNGDAAAKNSTGFLSSYLVAGKSQQSVTGMQDAFAEKLARAFAAAPKSVQDSTTIFSGYRSPERQAQLWADALAKYGSPEAARKWVAPPGKSEHNMGNAADLSFGDANARDWFHQNASQFGLSFPLNNEAWHIEDSTARQKSTMDGQQANADKLNAQSDAYKKLIAGANEFTQAQTTEQNALSMSTQAASAYRHEQELLVQAQQAGINLSDAQREKISLLAQGMAAAEAKTNSFQQAQENAGQASHFFAEQSADALTGLIMGTTTAADAMKQLAAAIVKAALQSAFLNEGPLATGGKSTGLLGSIFGSIFGAKTGGFITPNGIQHFDTGGHVRGPGSGTSDSIPAYLSDGEFVVNAASTRKNRQMLEAIKSGKAPRLQSDSIVGGSAMQRGTVVNTFAPTIPITIHASGNKETDQTMRDALMKEMDTMLSNKMTEFVQDNQRPGSMLAKRKFS